MWFDRHVYSLQDLLAIDAPRRHKVSVHVLSREMDSCEYRHNEAATF